MEENPQFTARGKFVFISSKSLNVDLPCIKVPCYFGFL